jgi:putative (di)nucleoside polyphosphate hydrolase
MNKKDELPLMIGVVIVLLNNKNKIFVGRRIDNPRKFWQMPQGGVDNNEGLLQAAKRELKEETNIQTIKFIKELDGWTEYNLPKNLLGKVWKGKYKGQKQKWFIMKFLGDEKEINVKTKHPEFFEWKWIEIDKITDMVVGFKLDVYKKVKEEVKMIIN